MSARRGRLTGWLWCEVCKAFRHVNGPPLCWRCGWDMRARVAPKWSTLARYRRGELDDLT